MPRRLHKTLLDYMVIAISPALIMFLIGSLVFFLLEVFYEGPYLLRLRFIFAMFVMGAVCVGRLSIEEGKEYAMLFAAPLALVTIIATFRFVKVEGPFASFGPLINIGLVALIWWCAHKLTWDCTVIDEQQDASGEGLLHHIGLEEDVDVVEGTTEDPNARQQEELARTSSEAGAAGWWQRFIERRRRPHAPGIWIIYVSLIALPMFGFFNGFIDSSDTSSRSFAFRMLAVYVASALGLLLTTSFLGLRRYLRQRRIEMPGDMAGMWLGIGGVMIVVLLLFCVFLPRPSNLPAVAELPLQLMSPDNLKPSRWGFGNDGPQRPEAERTGQPGDSQEKDSEQQAGAQPSGSSPPDNRSSSDERSPSQAAQQQQQSPQTSNQQSQQQQSPQTSNQQSQQENRSSQDAQQQGSDANNQSSRSQSGRPEDQQGQSRSQENQQASGDTKQRGQEGGERGQAERRQAAARQQRSDASKTAKNDSPKAKQKASPEDQAPSESDRASQATQQQPAQQPSTQPRPPLNPGSILSSLGSLLGSLVKLLFWAALVAVALYLAWKYRDDIRAAWEKFVAELRALWQRLFGRSAREAAEQVSQEERRVLPRFADYPDPFLAGTASRYAPEELVRYSFEALEAWAREHGCARVEDQTPLEFAKQVGSYQRSLRQEARRLAELYSRIAYARATIDGATAAQLRELWQLMRSQQKSERDHASALTSDL